MITARVFREIRDVPAGWGVDIIIVIPILYPFHHIAQQPRHRQALCSHDQRV